jgi:signal transduction histidine kinase
VPAFPTVEALDIVEHAGLGRIARLIQLGRCALRFQRGEPFFTTKSGGLGMGLSICRSIIEAHGGRLWVSPRALHGTALRFTVPIRVEM